MIRKYDGNLYFAKVKENAIIPTKRNEDAGYDFYACSEEDIRINPHETKLIPTGIACAVSNDYFLYLVERGSSGSKGMKKSCGVIDSGFRNEIFAAIYNGNDYSIIITDNVDKVELKDEIHITQITSDGKEIGCTVQALYYPKSKAICQGVVLPVPFMNVKEITYKELKQIPSERGEGMLGSSGK